MKTTKIMLMVTVAALLLIAGGCRKRPINGDLDGQWQIMKIDYKDGDEVTPDRMYYCLFLHTVNLTSYGGAAIGGNMAYDKDKMTLRLQFPTTAPERLQPWGIRTADTEFKIRELTGSKMTLESDVATINFRKF